MKLDKLQEAYDEMFDFITDLPSGLDGFKSDFDAAYKELLEAKSADVVPVIHGTPISKIRPQKYEIYEQAGTGENGEILYHKRIYVDEKNSAEYCPVCNKRLCSRFRSFCPNCGAKMDLEEDK